MTDSAVHDLDVRRVTKRFGSFTAVNDVSFEIPSGRFFSILGPSGCGKTTLMRMLAGFAEPDEGEIRIKGRSMRGVPPNKRPANMVFQHLALFPMMSVAENVAYGLKRRGEPKADIAAKVDRILRRVGLPGAGDKRIEQLSGGQKQRVAIARCLVLEPALLLLDEPLGALDLKLREHMKVELKQLQAEFGTTFVYITHDQSEALVMSDQVAVMNHGRFEQVGTPQELYYSPATAFVAGFVGQANRWTGRVEARDGASARVVTEDGLTMISEAPAPAGAAVELFVRPEAITLGRDEAAVADVANRLHGTVRNVLFDGANSTALLAGPGGGEIRVQLPQTGSFANLHTGESLWAGWSAGAVTCFPKEAS